jgi:hypothetical protein
MRQSKEATLTREWNASPKSGKYNFSFWEATNDATSNTVARSEQMHRVSSSYRNVTDPQEFDS